MNVMTIRNSLLPMIPRDIRVHSQYSVVTDSNDVHRISTHLLFVTIALYN
jgi:hypothetical protein